MKKLKYLLVLAVLAFGFTSCEKDKTIPKNSNDTIVGTWLLKKYVRNNYQDGVFINNTIKTEFISEDSMQFKNDGTGEFNGKYVDYKIINDNGKVNLFIKNADIDYKFEVKVLNDTELVTMDEWILSNGYKLSTDYFYKKVDL